MKIPLRLKEAQDLILALAEPTPVEKIPLDHGLGRITAEAHRAILPVPSFDHSTRDGYAIRRRDLLGASKNSPVSLEVKGEIPAGRTDIPDLLRGTAMRIMTGAPIPKGGNLVMAQEDTRKSNGGIIVDKTPAAGTFIRKKGSDLAKGATVAGKGTPLTPHHLALLATAGTDLVKVHQRVRVAVVCTGSELISQEESPKVGQVISSNILLLDGLIKTNGGITESLSTATDHAGKIIKELEGFINRRIPLIITTGGMGPGKFDLMAEVFRQMGIRVVYDSLKVKPGRATMLGKKAASMVFALPGPPPAVKLLFHELVKPALLKIAGHKRPANASIRAELAESIKLRSGKSLLLKEGYYFVEGGKILVRSGNKSTETNCILLLPPRRVNLKKGEMVSIHPTTGTF